MKKLSYKIDIAAPPKKVWEVMLSHGTYEEWVAASWPETTYEGEWKAGEKIKFIGQDQSGTLAKVMEVQPYSFVALSHIAVLNPKGIEDRDSEVAKGWINTTETYTLTEQQGQTKLLVEMNIKPDWEKMFDEGWPKALSALKTICERHD